MCALLRLNTRSRPCRARAEGGAEGHGIRILALNDYYLPGYTGGGSIRALANLIGHLKGDFGFVVLTGDRDALAVEPYPEESRLATQRAEGYEIRYCARGLQLTWGLARALTERWGVVYLNSSLSPYFSVMPLLMRRVLPRARRTPFVLAPRGELMEGALEGKATKKKFFLWLARVIGLYRGVTFHATSAEEADGIRRRGLGEQRIVVAMDLPPLVVESVKPRRASAAQGRLRVVFVSRIDSKKNLLFALQTLQEASALVDLDIVGPIANEEYWRRCRQAIERLPGHVRVNYVGAVPHDQILEVFGSHDLFFLPTLGENNGYVILESLLAGCPVLVSDRTPWRGLQAMGIGRDISLEDSRAFVRAIDEFGAMGAEDRRAMSERAATFGQERLRAGPDVAATRELFRTAAAERCWTSHRGEPQE